MNLTFADLKECKRNTDRAKAIRAELDFRLRWMPKDLREIARQRFVMKRSMVRTCMELSISHSTYCRRVTSLAEWLIDTNE